MDTIKQITVTTNGGSLGRSNKLNPIRCGFVMGLLTGVLHLLWAALVSFGYGQPVVDFIFTMHFVEPIYSIRPFELGNAVLLVAAATIGGFVCGYLFSLFWNLISGSD